MNVVFVLRLELKLKIVADVRHVLGVNSNTATSRNIPVGANQTLRRTYSLRESTLDPQLGPRIKVEPKSRSTTPTAPVSLDPAAMHRSYAPPMQSWPNTSYDQSPMTQDHSAFGSLYTTPSSDGSPGAELPRRTNGRSKSRKTSGSNASLRTDEGAEIGDGLNGNTRLKGVQLPGMDLFDSATPEMKRKRNQKKETSVVAQLMVTSGIVEAEEFVFDADGQHRRTRPITGNPEEDDGMSPLPGESTPEPDFPQPKKRPGRRPRQALAQKEVNTNRVSRRRGESHHPPFNNGNRNLPYYDGADQDDELTYGRRRPARRSGLSIHRDNSGPEITFDRPAPLTTLTSGFRNPFQGPHQQQHPQATYQNGFVDRRHHRQPSASFGTGFRPSNGNPLNVPAPNFGSFGHLNGQSMLQNAAYHNGNPFPLPNGQQAFAAFHQQQFAMGQQPFNPDGNVFQTPTNNFWDVFGAGSQDMTFQNGETDFHVNTDFGSVNPLFFSSNNPVPEDDEATVSPPSEK